MADALYRGNWKTRAKAICDAAYADPATQCWRCGKTLAQHKPGDTWQAGHLHDGDKTSPAAPEARSCNARAGQHRAWGNPEPRSEW